MTVCYLALYAVNLAWALFVLDPMVMGGYLHASLGYGDLFVLTWFLASAETVGGALGTGWNRMKPSARPRTQGVSRSGATASHANEPEGRTPRASAGGEAPSVVPPTSI